MNKKKYTIKQENLYKGSLTYKRLKEYENFRHNLRLLQATVGFKNTFDLSQEIDLCSKNRFYDLLIGKATAPKPYEVKRIAKYFNVTPEDLINKKATIIFQ